MSNRTNYPSHRAHFPLLFFATALWLFASGCQQAATADPSDAEGDRAAKSPKKQAEKNPVKKKQDDDRDHPFQFRTPAPSLDGGVDWINTAGPIDIRDLRGKFVVLDFWTYCCINCMHILPQLKKLEHAYPKEIVVIGVHSAKFDTEKGSDNILQAVLRHDIEHPVVNDANHVIWRRYGVSGWPALRVIDPEGNVIATHGGEIDFETLDRFFKKAIAFYKEKGLTDDTPMHFDLARERKTYDQLRFPGKVLADEASDRLYIADSGHNRIVVTTLEGKLIEIIGTGEIGARDGGFGRATFDHPQGMALAGNALYVSDTENHLIRRVDLDKKTVTTIAGNGKQNRGIWPGMDRVGIGAGSTKLPDRWASEPTKIPIASPWALAIHDDYLYIAMAGPHQIWRMSLDEKLIEVYAGNGREDIADGKLRPDRPPRVDPSGYGAEYSSFAQPSGLASDGKWLYVADSEGSSIRAVPFDSKEEVRTVVGAANLPQGASLFTFGDEDGRAGRVRLQHVLGVAHNDGQLYVADTYNNKVKVVDVRRRTAKTLVGSGDAGSKDDPPAFDEPAGISYAGGRLYVADTNNHLIRVVELESDNKVRTLKLDGLKAPAPPKRNATPSFAGAAQVDVPATAVKPKDGKVSFAVKLNLPEGWKLNTLGPMHYLVEATGARGPLDRGAIGKAVWPPEDQRSADFVIELPVSAAEGQDKTQVSLTFFYCRDGAEGFCKVGSVVWSVPLEISATAKASSVSLVHDVQ